MAYEPLTWVLGLSGGTAINDVNLNHMEQGIADAHDLAAAAADADHTHESADITDATSANVVDTLVKRDNQGGIAVTRVTGLSTATSNSAAVPKSQLDSGLAGKSDSTHTHDYSATGHAHTAADVTDFDAEVEALIGATVVQGENVTVVYDAVTHTVTVSADAAAGLDAVTYADLPAGDTLTILKNGDGTWPDRYTSRTDVYFRFIGPLPAPNVATPPAVDGMYEGDTHYVTP